MDLSSLPEDQRQQLQKIQQLFQEHQQQQQQQQQQASSQAYDPTQAVQPYDQSYYAYYQQYHDPNQSQPYPQQQDQPQQQNQYYDYYQPNYSNAYQQQPPPNQQQPPHAYPDSASAESNPPQAGESGAAAAPPAAVPVQGQQDARFSPAVGDQKSLGFAVPVGLNPAAAAAVAALSQLTQFAGTMEAAEKAMALVRGGGFGPAMGHDSGLGHFMGPGPMHHGPGPFHMPPFGVGLQTIRGAIREQLGARLVSASLSSKRAELELVVSRLVYRSSAHLLRLISFIEARLVNGPSSNTSIVNELSSS